MSWSCPACVKNRHRSHSSHTLGPDCQWAIATTRSEGARKHRTGHHPRDPIVKASGEPTSSLRVDLKSADAPSLADRGIEPESLSPEEAARRRKDKSLSATPVPPATSLPLTPKPLSIAPGPPGTPTPGTPGGTTKRRVDASTQADTPESRVVPADAIGPSVEKEESEVAEPSWSQHDLGAVLQQLKSLRPGIVRRALRRLHIRWFHCSASRMKMLLTAAGVKPDILELVDEIVNACSICCGVLFRSLGGMEDFCEETEVLEMLKPGFGLKDAPRLWNKALRKVLGIIGVRAIATDNQLYVKHDSKGVLILAISVHVDDLKLTGIVTEMLRAKKVLEDHFDELKCESGSFEHLGLAHSFADGRWSVDQSHYAKELKLIPESDLRLHPDDLASAEVAKLYMSLL
ncbi:unnamed protein product, partial [Durusdinium trenchii]